VQNALEIDYTKPHPFRAGLMGRPRLYFVVPDEQGEIIESEFGATVAQPVDYHGFARARFEIPLYSHTNSAKDKIDDDYVDALLGLMNVFGVHSKEQTPAERRERTVPPALRLDAIEARTPYQSAEQTEREIATHDAFASLAEMLAKKEQAGDDSDGYFSL
jgi:hypothetical protein